MFEFFAPFDLSVAKWVNGLCANVDGVLGSVLKGITSTGNYGLIFIIAAAVTLAFGRTRKFGAVVSVALLLGMLFTNILLKNVMRRARPFSDRTTEFYKFWQAAGALKESGYSFPSGHTTAAAAFGVGAFLSCKKRLSFLFLIIPVVMGFTRLYFVVHYASDVIGGMLLGAVAAVMAFFIIKLIFKAIENRRAARE